MRSALRLASLARSARVPAPVAPAVRAAFAPRVSAVAGLHSSARAAASEPTGNPLDDPRLVELRNKIQTHDGARNAILKLGELMQSKGVDLSKPPSATQVIKLGMDPAIREAGQNLMVQLKDAGVDINPEIFSKVVADEGNDGKGGKE